MQQLSISYHLDKFGGSQNACERCIVNFARFMLEAIFEDLYTFTSRIITATFSNFDRLFIDIHLA